MTLAFRFRLLDIGNNSNEQDLFWVVSNAPNHPLIQEGTRQTPKQTPPLLRSKRASPLTRHRLPHPCGVAGGFLFGMALFLYFFVILGGYKELDAFAQIVAKIDLFTFVAYTAFASVLGVVACRESRSYDGFWAGIFTGILLGLAFKTVGYLLHPEIQVQWIIFFPIGCTRSTIGAILCLPSGAVGGSVANFVTRILAGNSRHLESGDIEAGSNEMERGDQGCQRLSG